MRRSSLFLTIVAALGGCAEPEVERPNVVFIVCDTLRADRTSTYGHFRTTTPNLDALGGRGTVFERAFAMSSWTLPSMSMLMTGEVKSLADPSILRDHIHVAESFLDAGYDTAAVVANPILNDRLGYDRGIESFVVDRAEQMSWRADEVFGKGLDWIDGRSEGERPFFLWLHPVDPHHPYEPLEPQSFAAGPGVDPDAGAEEETRDAARAALQAQREGHPESMLAEELSDADWDEVAAIRSLYDSEVFQFDLALGQLVDSLRERGLLESTIIVVTSDHGEGLMERPSLSDLKHVEDEVPDLYRRHGLMLHDEQVSIPLVFAGPGVPRGVRRPDWVQHIDVVPTLHGLCDLPVKRPQPGQAMFEVAGGGRDVLFAVCSRSHSVTVDERWRLHLPKEFRRKRFGAKPELYDLEADPDERRPIDDPARVEAMTRLIREWEQAHAPVSLGGALDQATINTLRSLGYGGEVEQKNLDRPAGDDR